MTKTCLTPEAATGIEVGGVSPLGDKKAVAALAGGMSTRWVGGEMRKGMPHLKLGRRRTKFDLAEVKEWLKNRYGTQAYSPKTGTQRGAILTARGQ